MTTSKKKQFIVSINENLLEDTRTAYIPEDMLDNDEYDLVVQDIIIRGFMDFDENTLRDYCNPKTKGKVVSVEPIKSKKFTLVDKKAKISIEYKDGKKFLKDKILCGTSGFMLRDDKGNRIWVWINEE